MPFIMSDAAMGVDADAHTYMGMAATSIKTIDRKLEPRCFSKKPSGIKALIIPAAIIPTSIALAMEPSNSYSM